jgi:carbamoyl-phosphate synthase large subunit
MKSVGEVMAIGRTFEEVIQKGLRMIGQGMHGFVGNRNLSFSDVRKELAEPTDMRIFSIADALTKGISIEEIHDLTSIDKWFLYKLRNITDIGNRLSAFSKLTELPSELLMEAKVHGFSDFQVARLVLDPEPENIHAALLKVRKHRKSQGIIPYVRQIDTLAAEYPALTNYLYLTYSASEHDLWYTNDKRSVVVLGSGAYRIGSSVEFDWCSVNAIDTIRRQGMRAVMINYNPETVSTDYDICDRLYFDELSFERVMDIIELEMPYGVILSMGGQIPNNLAMRLYRENIPVLGTSPGSIDRAEDRHKFSTMLDELDIDQPRWQELTSVADILGFADRIGFPLLVRPSYVLSGAAMNVVSNRNELTHFLDLAARISKQYPVVVSEFIENAKEIEIDAVASKGEIIAYAISEHVEFAGVHSGDATIVFPAQKIYFETARRIKKISRQIAGKLNITGPFNIQFLARDNDIKVIECNLRASRSMPFVSKVLKTNLIELATRVMLGQVVEKPAKSVFDIDYVGVKAPQFSFSRLAKADPVLGVDMASTGEVGCIGEGFYEAILKAMYSVGYRVPRKAILLSTGPARSKVELINSARALSEKGYRLYATRGTRLFLGNAGIEAEIAHWPDEKETPNTIDLIRNGEVDLVVNIPKDLSASELSNDYSIRRTAIDFNVPLLTNARLASAFILAFCKLSEGEIAIKSWDEY